MPRRGDDPDTPLEQLAAEAAGQWGMFTTRQAVRLGLTRKALAHATSRHHVDHAETRGVYRFAGTPLDVTIDHIRSHWLALSPEQFLHERLKQLRSPHWDDAVVSHLTAAHHIYLLGNRQPDDVDFTVSTPRRSRDHTLRFHHSAKPQWHTVNGLPVTTIAQTIADLYTDNLDHGHLGEILYDALLRHRVTLHDIAAALDPVTAGTGRDTALRLLQIAGAPPEIVTASDLLHSLSRS